MARPAVHACITRALMRAGRAPMTVCSGMEKIQNRMCELCEYWDENQYNPEEGRIAYRDGMPTTVVHACGLADGFRASGKDGPCCNGDPDMLGYCHACEFYERERSHLT